MAEQPPKKEVELLDAVLKPLVDKTEELWAQMFSQVLGSERFAESMGQALKNQLLLQRTFQEQLERYFRALNLPTRRDLEAIVRELGELRMAVERLEARLALAESSPSARRPGKRERSRRATGKAGQAPSEAARPEAESADG